MDVEKSIGLIKRNTEEVLTEVDLRHLLEIGVPLKHYIGFEISGKIHLGGGIVCMSKVKDFMDAGVDCSIFLADWHSWINDKLGGDIETIKKVAAGYFKEGMKASLKCVGADPEEVGFVLATELYHNNDEFWQTVIDVAKHTTLARVQRSITILGRKEGESVDFAKMIYPVMQVADIFSQGVNLAHSGIDQRKAQVIAREVALKLKHPLSHKSENYKPIAVHHNLLLGLQQPPVWPVPKERLKEMMSEMKMSKSIPNSAVFITDSPEEIRKKLGSAFCPAKITEYNPVLDYAKNLVFREEKSELLVERPQKFGGNTTYSSYAELERDFIEGRLHPLDLKKAVAESIVELLKPARKHFESPKIRRMAEEMERLTVTR